MKPFIASRLTNGEKNTIRSGRLLPPPMNKEQASEYLLKVKEIFDRLGIIFWLRGGTALGAIRDGSFIEWDNDIDIGVYEDDAEKVWFAILEMEEFGLKVTHTSIKDNSFRVLKDLIGFGFASWSRHKGTMWRAERHKEIFDVFSEFIEWPFLGTTFKIPKDYKRYFESHYGDTWRIPKKMKPKLYKV